MIGNTLTHDRTDGHTVESAFTDRRAEAFARDAGEFSSEAMPGAYGALYSSAIGLAIIAATLVLFCR